MSAGPRPLDSRLVLGLIAVSTPLALGFETAARRVIMPPDFALLRDFLRPTLEPVAWALCVLSVLACLGGVALQHWLVQRLVARLPPGQDGPEARGRKRVEALYLSTSVPQVPALLATFLFTLGAPLLPVAVNLALATAGVVLQGFASRALD